MTERYDFVREEVILHELNAHGRVVVKDLAARLGVSTVTIRKDLDSMEGRALVRRVRGGAVVPSGGEEGAFSDRLRQSASIKRELGRRLAPLVHDGDVIALDSSTSSYYLALELVERRDLKVVTYGMRTAMLFMDHSDATVMMPGGVLRRASGSMVGAFSNVLEGRGRVAKGFFGVATLSRQLGLLELSSEEAETKKSLVGACDAVYGIFTSAKILGFGLHPFAHPAEVTALFTDEHATDDFVDEWQRLGVAVTRVAVSRISGGETPSLERQPPAARTATLQHEVVAR
ncbi:DeoR family transcriptional regulator [Glaciihabitans tibetensis]|uniref:DeoR family transcriptional regulator n=1 Tax=Glaciihabitans tibetensis TaxID=1266600 RepID=A0A2T0V1L4_9MICO|nr:DeoR/GlpR family DNA-binding transcription regulator [Glaciihabitans tibetensis]PRY64066.1 DeoR family transcriptional regulator [Glaciihabitans tibetensis]